MSDTNTLAGRWFTIDAFSERAARILSSDIARRQDLATMGTQLKFVSSGTSDGRTSWRMDREVPPEAETESAFTRIRPIFLQGDPVFHGMVMTAIGGLTREAPSHQKAATRAVRDAWRSFEKSNRWSMGVATEASGLEGAMRTDRQIARDFLYGDLVHAEADAQRRLAGVSREDRLIAAVPWVSDAIHLTEATRRLILDLKDAGVLTPRPS